MESLKKWCGRAFKFSGGAAVLLFIVGIVIAVRASSLASGGAFVPTHEDYRTYLALENLKVLVALPIMPLVILASLSGLGLLGIRFLYRSSDGE